MANADNSVDSPVDDIPEENAYDVFNELVGASSSTEGDLPDANEVETSDQVDEEANLDAFNDAAKAETETLVEQGDATPDPLDTTEADPWAGATDSQIDAYRNLQLENQKLNNNVKANSGRVSALTKKLGDLTKQPDEEGPAKGDQEVAPQDLEGKSFAEVEEEWPEVAGYVRDQVSQAIKQTQNAMRREMAPLQESHESSKADRETQAVNTELESLHKLHPDWQVVNASESFYQWHSNQPEGIQKLRSSQSAADNARLLDLFKFDSGKPPTAPHAAKKTDLSEHAELPRKGAAKPQGLPDDPAEYFDLITST